MSEKSDARLSNEEAREIVRRGGGDASAVEGGLTLLETAALAGLAPEEVRRHLRGLRSLGAAVDASSGDLTALREERQTREREQERDEENAAIQHEVATRDEGYEVETGGNRLPKATRWVLLAMGLFFLLTVAWALFRRPPTP